MACSLSTDAPSVRTDVLVVIATWTSANRRAYPADKREFIKISQAVGMGFLIMVRSIKLSSAQLSNASADRLLTEEKKNRAPLATSSS